MYDGAGNVLDDALIEIWQANRAGRYRHPEDDREELPLEDGFDGFGRCPTDAEGTFRFVTVKPGALAPEAPHINVIVLARGLLRHLFTRIYFPDEAEANASDPLLLVARGRRGARDPDRAPGRRRAALRHPPPRRAPDSVPRRLGRVQRGIELGAPARSRACGRRCAGGIRRSRG